MATKKSGKKKSGSKKSGKAKTGQKKSAAKKGVKKAAKKKTAKKSSARSTAAKRSRALRKLSAESLISQTNRVLSGKANPVDVASDIVENAKEIVTEVLETARGAIVNAGKSGVETAQNIGTSVRHGAESVLPRAPRVHRAR